MSNTEAYLSLNERYQELMRRHAVMTAQEAEKKVRRDELRGQLIDLGVDPDRPEEEFARLQKEMEESQKAIEAELDEFERKLRGEPMKKAAMLEIEEDIQKCSVCGEPQFLTTSGMTCKNGHGGVLATADLPIHEDIDI